jgi:HEAT repeat protein
MTRYRHRLQAHLLAARKCGHTTESVDLERLQRLGISERGGLFELTQSPSPSIAALACWAIARLGYLSTRQGVLAACSGATHRSPKVRAAAARALLASRSKDAVDALRKLVKDCHMEPRIAAVYALGHLGLRVDVRLLCSMLAKDEHSRVRDFTAEALGNLADRRALGALQKALSDRSPSVRKSAAYALKQINERHR